MNFDLAFGGARNNRPLTETTTGMNPREQLIALEHSMNGNGPGGEEEAVGEVQLTSLEDFAEFEEKGAGALVGSEDDVLIPEGGDVMFYGDGGAGKTTLSIDLACHLASARDWLDIPVGRAARVMLIENEGPRPLFRKKLRRKLAAWDGPGLEGRVCVLEAPWGEFSFAPRAWRDRLAELVADKEIDVLMVGPVTRAGMDEAGTLQQVRDFMTLVADVRKRSGRRLTVILVHHENKGGTVSGAWEGSGDTLLHVGARGHGLTALHVQKARWSSTHHKTTLELAWTAGEGFLLKGERDYVTEIEEILGDGKPRTVAEIAAPKESTAKPGIGARPERIRETLEGSPDRFESRTGERAKEVGRNPNAIVWGLVPTPGITGTTEGSPKVLSGVWSGGPPLKGTTLPGNHTAGTSSVVPPPGTTPTRLARPPHEKLRGLQPLPRAPGPPDRSMSPDAEYERITGKFGDDLDGEAA